MSFLKHYGVGKLDGAPGRGSGRYPLGSGEKPNQRAGDFLARLDELKRSGMTDKEIADSCKMTVEMLRANRSLAKAEIRSGQVATAKKLKEQGLTLREIASKMGFANDSSVRSLLDEDAEARMNVSLKTAANLKKLVDEKGMIEVGAGVERELGISKEKMKEALAVLETEGYMTYGGRVDQATNPGNKTTITVLTPPGTEHKEIFNLENVHSVSDYTSKDNGDTIKKNVMQYPASLDSKRLMINYADMGGDAKDGVVEIRRGVEDLSLGNSNYAQVRILVDGTHYIKGMAVYADDLPDGIDLRFNTNKTSDKSMKEVLKPIHTEDPNNPFGSLIKANGQSTYIGKDGKEHLSLINKRAEEGDWDDWADKVPSQFLAKQPLKLVNQQLNLTMANKQAEYEEICSLTNPTLKKHLLSAFADDCDASAVHLKAAALPRQKYKVILPLTSIKENEIYAPSIKDGTTVALIRYPHGGTFEIPIVKVNNKNAEGKRVIDPSSPDAIGIRKSVADRLSGADFDGDTVMAIPITGKVKIKSTAPLEGLKDYDPKVEYPERPGMKYLGKKQMQIEMGRVTNLITDMTIMGASPDELARATRHSMTIIDANKHKLDYKRSEVDNDIAALRKKYQQTIDEDGKVHYKAATLLSRAKNEKDVIRRQGQPTINPDGSLSYKTVDNPTYVKNGKTITKTQKSTQMAETKDARTLISKYDTEVEHLYADYANFNKHLANQARKTMITTKDIQYSPSAKQTYQKQFDSLNKKLLISEANRPKERMAQIIANAKIDAFKNDNPNIDSKQLKKFKSQALDQARTQVGAERKPIFITDDEYKAIQAGAISPTKLRSILKYADADTLRQKAMPRNNKGLSNAQKAQIKAMQNAGYTLAEIGERFGVSATTISKELKG